MPHAPNRRANREAAPRVNLYDEVTNKIIAQLEAGRLPWVQPWTSVGAAGPCAGLPRNAASGRAYSGINVLILWGAVIEAGYSSQSWLTFRQAIAAGGAVRKGEHGTTVVYADRFTPEAEKTRAAQEGGEARAVPFLKRFTLFNLAQIDGLPGVSVSEPAPLPEREIVPVGESVIAASGIDFRIGGSRAYYAPEPDFVAVPPQPAFRDQINYYRTAFHELTHATGHPSRLARDLKNAFGSKDYARAPETEVKPARAEITATLGTYVDLHRHAATRAVLLESPGVALRLMVAHAITGSPLWTVRPEAQATRNDDIGQSVAESRGEAVFDAARLKVLRLLHLSEDEPRVTGGNGDAYGLVGLFLRLVALDDDAVMAVLAIVMGETLEAGSAVVDALAAEIGVPMATWWEADDAFFDAMRDREVLVAMVEEVAGPTIAQANSKEKGKTLKAIVRAHLAGTDGREKVEGWVPRWMAFPPSAYTTRGGVGSVAAAERAAAARREWDEVRAATEVSATEGSDEAEVIAPEAAPPLAA